jgi:hypothetical protein
MQPFLRKESKNGPILELLYVIQLPMQCSSYLVINYGYVFTYVEIHGCKDLEVYL